MAKFIDRTGQQYGYLTLVKYLGKRRWMATCDHGGKFCKGKTTVFFQNLNPKHHSATTSCGCVRREKAAELQPYAISRISPEGRERAGKKSWEKRSREAQAKVMTALNQQLFCPDCGVRMGINCPKCTKHREWGITFRELADRGGFYENNTYEKRQQAHAKRMKDPAYRQKWTQARKEARKQRRPIEVRKVFVYTRDEEIYEILERRFLRGQRYRQIAKALGKGDSVIIRICQGERHKEKVERWKTIHLQQKGHSG